MSYETGRSTDVDPSNVMTRDDFAVFLSAVLKDFRSTGESEWENGTLDRFLDVFAAFAGARIVNEPVRDQEEASWQLFAEIVRAATGYEQHVLICRHPRDLANERAHSRVKRTMAGWTPSSGLTNRAGARPAT